MATADLAVTVLASCRVEKLRAVAPSFAEQAEVSQRPSRRFVILTGIAVVGLAACAALAAYAASQGEGGFGEDAIAEMGAVAEVRRLGVDPSEEIGCRIPRVGDPCYRHIRWAMDQGIHQRPDLFPALTPASSFDDFQMELHIDPFAQCPRPCSVFRVAAEATWMLAAGLKNASDDSNLTKSDSEETGEGALRKAIGWEPSDRMVAQGQWCGVDVPSPHWKIRGCGDIAGVRLKILTYNLFWWNLFGRRHGNGGSVGRLIAGNSLPDAYDIMGFQECENIGWVLGDAGLANDFAGMTGPHALCLAYRRSAWDLLSDGASNVGEDRYDQWYSTRAAMWVRLRHVETGQPVFFVNHHGPLPVDSGGLCGGEATAYNLLKLISREARQGDVIVLVGDFNAGPNTQTLQSLHAHLFPVFTGNSFGGVDHVLSSCSAVGATRNLGDGGSDHDALEVVFNL